MKGLFDTQLVASQMKFVCDKQTFFKSCVAAYYACTKVICRDKYNYITQKTAVKKHNQYSQCEKVGGNRKIGGPSCSVQC